MTKYGDTHKTGNDWVFIVVNEDNTVVTVHYSCDNANSDAEAMAEVTGRKFYVIVRKVN